MKTWEQTKRLLVSEEPILIYARRGSLDGIRQTVNVLTIEAKDSKGYTPLMLAAMHGHYEAAALLLSLTADVHARDNHGNSVLMAATFTGHLSIVRLLLNHGANPDDCNFKRQTALLFARTFGMKDIEKVLVRAS